MEVIQAADEWKKECDKPAHIQIMPPEVQAKVFVPAAEPGRVHDVLLEHGVAVVTDVFSEEQCQNLEALFAEDLLGIVDTDATTDKAFLEAIKKDTIRTWPSDKAPLGEKFVSYYGLPQGRMAWTVRKDPTVRTVFENIFKTKDLCVGMDNIFYNPRPCEKVPDTDRKLALWPHTDQNDKAPLGGDWEIYQAVVYVWGVDTETSATVTWVGSHNSEPFHRTMAAAKNKEHFCRLPDDMVQEFAQKAYRVPVPRGGMLLWNSRTTHQGWSNGPRLAVPVCYEPASRRTEETRERKLNVLQKGGVTTHWASLGITHFDAALKYPPAEGIVLKTTAHEKAAADEEVRKLM